MWFGQARATRTLTSSKAVIRLVLRARDPVSWAEYRAQHRTRENPCPQSEATVRVGPIPIPPHQARRPTPHSAPWPPPAPHHRAQGLSASPHHVIRMRPGFQVLWLMRLAHKRRCRQKESPLIVSNEGTSMGMSLVHCANQPWWRCRESNPGPCRLLPYFSVCSRAIASRPQGFVRHCPGRSSHCLVFRPLP
jgi:hypothetical protein